MRYLLAILFTLLLAPALYAQEDASNRMETELDEVIVSSRQRERYTRRNNPAVELIQKVIANKRAYKLEDNDHYSYEEYEKLITSLDDIRIEDLDKGIFKRMPFLIERIEICPETEKFILPVSLQETSSKHLYKKSPQRKRTLIEGINSEGVNELFSTGDMLNVGLADVFTEIDINDNNIRFLQRHFVSPLSTIEATRFYQYYIADTVLHDNYRCIRLDFKPTNPQDFGFSGRLYILDDSTYRIKRTELRLPQNTNVNFVRRLILTQDYAPMSTGSWQRVNNDLILELYILKSLQGVQVRRINKLRNFTFEPLSEHLFHGKGEVWKQDNAMMRNDEFWANVRQVPLTKQETSMDQLVKELQSMPGFKYLIFGARALIENFVETGTRTTPSKIDIGPVNTLFGYNSIEGFRTRVSAQTTANLFPQLFFKGYAAYGYKDQKPKGSLRAEYTFDKKEYLPREYPKHSVWASATYDLETPTDQYLQTDKDNMFFAVKTGEIDQRSYIRRFQAGYERELRNGLSYSATLSNIHDAPAGELQYKPLNTATPLHHLTTTQATFAIRYCPGESFINTKQRRITISYDAPALTLSHTTSVKGLMGSQYTHNLTEAGIWKRFWLSSFGRFDVDAKVGKQWDKVPFPLLPVPPANLSYIIQKKTFSLLNNYEFLNDEYATLFLTYDLNGKILNRIPLIRRLKLREVIRFNSMWGQLSSKNNPYLSPHDNQLFEFPTRNGQQTTFAMTNTPYMEASFGIYNLFKLVHIEYVRRLSYLNHPDISPDGIRLAIIMNF